MTDLVERLRNWQTVYPEEQDDHPDDNSLYGKAADRIAALEAELRQLKAKIDMKGGDASSPTQWAYDQACAALDQHKARADKAEAALATARNDALEKAAKVASPSRPRPCDCDSCFCGNTDDAEAVAAWDMENAIAAAIRAMKQERPE